MIDRIEAALFRPLTLWVLGVGTPVALLFEAKGKFDPNYYPVNASYLALGLLGFSASCVLAGALIFRRGPSPAGQRPSGITAVPSSSTRDSGS